MRLDELEEEPPPEPKARKPSPLEVRVERMEIELRRLADFMERVALSIGTSVDAPHQ
jgi:hypothetical protein